MLNLRCIVPLTALALAACVSMQASAATFAGVSPVPDAELAAMRGGFSLEHGVKVSFGIDRLSFVNDQLASIEHLGLGQAGSSGMNVIQNGPGNHIDPSLLQSVASGNLGTVIQNSLDHQTIRSVNVYNITVTSRQLANAINIRHTLNDSLTRFGR